MISYLEPRIDSQFASNFFDGLVGFSLSGNACQGNDKTRNVTTYRSFFISCSVVDLFEEHSTYFASSYEPRMRKLPPELQSNSLPSLGQQLFLTVKHILSQGGQDDRILSQDRIYDPGLGYPILRQDILSWEKISQVQDFQSQDRISQDRQDRISYLEPRIDSQFPSNFFDGLVGFSLSGNACQGNDKTRNVTTYRSFFISCSVVDLFEEHSTYFASSYEPRMRKSPLELQSNSLSILGQQLFLTVKHDSVFAIDHGTSRDSQFSSALHRTHEKEK